jgi:general L-amino acid transport system permease protein
MAAAFKWTRENLFGSWMSALITIGIVLLCWVAIPPFIEWAFVDATLSGETKADCAAGGACWTFIRLRFPNFFYGRYPVDERWRVDLAGVLLVLFTVPVLLDRVRHKWAWVIALVLVYPVIAGVLLVGGAFGLSYVETSLWGGLMLNVILCFVALAGSLPLGILLALGRRSKLPAFRYFSVGFIELWRGVPLLTALFMATIILPLFLPDGVTLDRLVRAALALTLFTSAYMAEVVRGGLQGVPMGQAEAARSLGLGYWPMQVLIVLPQALRLVVPAIVNTAIDLFKDTTLVLIIGLFDLLGMVSLSLKDSAWLGMAHEGFVFATLVFFVCCLMMSLYSRRLERRLAEPTRRTGPAAA